MKIENTDIEQFVTADLWQLAVTLTKAKELSKKLLEKDNLKNYCKLVEADEQILTVLDCVADVIGSDIFYNLSISVENNKSPQ